MIERPARVSEILEEAVEVSQDSWDLREASFELDAACKRLGLPIIHRWDGDEIPYEILDQIRGEQAVPLLEVEYEGESWRVASIDLPPEFDGTEVRLIPRDHTPRWMSLVRSEDVVDDLG